MLTYDDFHAQMVDQFDMQEFKDAIGAGYSDEVYFYSHEHSFSAGPA